jgi:hypothetical protein
MDQTLQKCTLLDKFELFPIVSRGSLSLFISHETMALAVSLGKRRLAHRGRVVAGAWVDERRRVGSYNHGSERRAGRPRQRENQPTPAMGPSVPQQSFPTTAGEWSWGCMRLDTIDDTPRIMHNI